MTTHQLTYNPETDRWTCPCGYTLGDGRRKFLAKCKFKHPTLTRNQVKVEQPPKQRATNKRHTAMPGGHLSHRKDDLFGFAS